MEVEYPWVREELIERLNELSNPIWQKQAWIEKKFDTDSYFYNFDSMIHFFLDDWRFQDNIKEYIGIILKSEEEAQSITKLVATLFKVLHAVDAEGKSSDDDHITHPFWSSVISAAREALDAFSRAEYNGFPKKAD